MKPEIEQLLALQAADQMIAARTAEITGLPAPAMRAQNDLAAAESALKDLSTKIAAEAAKARRLEEDIRDQQQNIVKFRAQAPAVKRTRHIRRYSTRSHMPRVRFDGWKTPSSTAWG